jgi:hypothetical protein
MEEDISYCLNWIRHNENELLSKYEGKYIVINNKKVHNDFNIKQDAISYGIKKFGVGNFVVYLMVKDPVVNRIVSENEKLLGDLKKYLE